MRLYNFRQTTETALAAPVDNAQVSAELSPNMRTRPRENATPTPHPCEAHIIQQESFNKNTDTGSGAVVDNASGMAGQSIAKKEAVAAVMAQGLNALRMRQNPSPTKLTQRAYDTSYRLN